MIRFTDGDVAEILRAIMVNNRNGHPTLSYAALTAAGMPDATYAAAHRYAVRQGMITVTGQHNGVTRKGRRYAASATMPPTRRSRPERASALRDDDLDARTMVVRSLDQVEQAWESGNMANPDLAGA